MDHSYSFVRYHLQQIEHVFVVCFVTLSSDVFLMNLMKEIDRLRDAISPPSLGSLGRQQTRELQSKPQTHVQFAEDDNGQRNMNGPSNRNNTFQDDDRPIQPKKMSGLDRYV